VGKSDFSEKRKLKLSWLKESESLTKKKEKRKNKNIGQLKKKNFLIWRKKDLDLIVI